jgi:hypothetical protein
MPLSDADWNAMQIDEKLDWLRVAIEGMIEINNKNVDARFLQHKEIIGRIDAVEAAIRNIPRKA